MSRSKVHNFDRPRLVVSHGKSKDGKAVVTMYPLSEMSVFPRETLDWLHSNSTHWQEGVTAMLEKSVPGRGRFLEATQDVKLLSNLSVEDRIDQYLKGLTDAKVPGVDTSKWKNGVGFLQPRNTCLQPEDADTFFLDHAALASEDVCCVGVVCERQGTHDSTSWSMHVFVPDHQESSASHSTDQVLEAANDCLKDAFGKARVKGLDQLSTLDSAAESLIQWAEKTNGVHLLAPVSPESRWEVCKRQSGAKEEDEGSETKSQDATVVMIFPDAYYEEERNVKLQACTDGSRSEEADGEA